MTNNRRLIALWYQQSAFSQDSLLTTSFPLRNYHRLEKKLANPLFFNSLLVAIYTFFGLVLLGMINLDSYGPFPGA